METTINPFVVSSTQYEHLVKYADGTKRIARLFYSSGGYLCEFNKGSRKYGHYFDTTNVVSVKPQVKISKVARTRRFMTKVCSILEKNGLWSNILYDFRTLLALDDETLRKIVCDELSYEERHELARQLNLKSGSVSCGLDNLYYSVSVGIKSINYNSWEKDKLAEEFANAIAEKKQWCYTWRKGYDNRTDCKLGDDGVMRAWYSQEFKGYGNGHYYLAIDERHAIFCEND